VLQLHSTPFELSLSKFSLSCLFGPGQGKALRLPYRRSGQASTGSARTGVGNAVLKTSLFRQPSDKRARILTRAAKMLHFGIKLINQSRHGQCRAVHACLFKGQP
jgi:hypothetical protein